MVLVAGIGLPSLPGLRAEPEVGRDLQTCACARTTRFRTSFSIRGNLAWSADLDRNPVLARLAFHLEDNRNFKTHKKLMEISLILFPFNKNEKATRSEAREGKEALDPAKQI